MTNPLKFAYNKLDDGIMSLANAAVHAWNWTTGRSKADLANLLFLSAMGTGVYSGSVSDGLAGAIGSTVISSVPTYQFCSRNMRIEEQEKKATNAALKSGDAEIAKAWNKYFLCPFGLILESVSVIAGLSETSPEPGKFNSRACLNLELGLIGFSFYVTRADYLPPRKNCISRGIDILEEMLASKPQLGKI
jgi:hypothetical protein